MANQYESVFRDRGASSVKPETPFQRFRREHPEYDGVPDMKLAGALRNKVPAYKEMPIEQFYTSIGLSQFVSPKSNPTDGMSGAQKALAGSGKFFTDQALGIRQLFGSATREEADRKKQIDAPLMETGAGKLGYAGTGIASIVLPGAAAARGVTATNAAVQAGQGGNLARLVLPALTATRNAALPTTVLGAGTQGAALGFLQPVGSDDSRVQNAAFGFGLGATGQTIGNMLVGATRLAKGQAISQKGVGRKAADIIRENAIKGADNLMIPSPSAVPGVSRTLAEESLDDGIAGLQRTMIDPAYMTNQGRVNNAARVNYLRGIAGDDAAMAAAQGQREANNSSAFKAARGERFGTPVAQSPVDELNAALAGLRGNKPAPKPADVMSPLYKQLDEIKGQFAGGKSENLVGVYSKRIRDAQGDAMKLDNIRRDIALEMQQKPEGVNIRDLAMVYDALSGHLKSVSPSFREAIDGWARDSIPVDRMRIGQELIGSRSGSAVLDPVTGEQVLLPAQFSRAARDLDSVAQRATGFPRASASDYLTPDDLSRIGAVQDDLERQAFAQTAGGRPGSPTFDRLEMAGRVANSTLPIPQVVKDGFAILDRIGQDRLKGQLSEVLANPQQARELLKKYPPSDARVLESVLKRIGFGAGLSTNIYSTTP